MLKFFKNARLSEIMEELVLENEYEIAVPLFGAAFDRSLLTVLSFTENRRIQGLFKAFE